MNRNALHALLERYTANQCSAEERLLVEHWYELIGESRDFSLAEKDWELLENRIWEKLHPGKHNNSNPGIKPLWGRISKTLAGVAAAAAAVAIFGYYWFNAPDLPGSENISLVTAREQDQWKIHTNETEQPVLVKLADGSVIGLAPRSQLAVSTGFNSKNRDVRLLGKATFDVAKNPAVPFMLFCGEMVTKVIGTSFEVVAKSVTEPMEVIVKSGKVTVYRSHSEGNNATSASNGVILTPNQKATYYPENKQFVAGIADKPEPMLRVEKAGEAGEFVFEETPLNEIVNRLQEVYGIEIELEQESIASCPFTGNLSKQDLFTKLDLLCGSVNGAYEVRGTKILLMGKGCQ